MARKRFIGLGCLLIVVMIIMGLKWLRPSRSARIFRKKPRDNTTGTSAEDRRKGSDAAGLNMGSEAAKWGYSSGVKQGRHDSEGMTGGQHAELFIGKGKDDEQGDRSEISRKFIDEHRGAEGYADALPRGAHGERGVSDFGSEQRDDKANPASQNEEGTSAGTNGFEAGAGVVPPHRRKAPKDAEREKVLGAMSPAENGDKTSVEAKGSKEAAKFASQDHRSDQILALPNGVYSGAAKLTSEQASGQSSASANSFEPLQGKLSSRVVSDQPQDMSFQSQTEEGHAPWSAAPVIEHRSLPAFQKLLDNYVSTVAQKRDMPAIVYVCASRRYCSLPATARHTRTLVCLFM